MTFNKIIIPFIIINVFLIFISYIYGFNKSLWLDEILSIIFGREIIGLSFKEIFTIDPHNPFFYIILNFGQNLIKLFVINVNDHLFLLKLINLVGFIPLFFAFKILRKEKVLIDLNIVFILLISSNYFIFYILDLRPYFLLLSFSLLVSVLNLTNLIEKKYKILFLISSITLSALHIYGLTISMSIIVYRLILSYLTRNYQYLKINILFFITLLIVFLFFYFFQITDTKAMSTLKYIGINYWYFRIFIEWTLNSIIYILLISILLIFQFRNDFFSFRQIKKFINSDFIKIFFNLTIPALILILVIMIVSYLITPIIHFKPLIVILPNLILYSGIISLYAKQTKIFYVFLIIFLIFLTTINIQNYLKNLLFTQQNIEWVVKNTFTKNCEDIDVYVNDSNKKDFIKITKQISKIYSKYNRPIKSLSEIDIIKFKKESEANNCNTLIFNYHNYGLENFIKQNKDDNLDLIINYAPNVVDKKSSKAGAIVSLKKLIIP